RAASNFAQMVFAVFWSYPFTARRTPNRIVTIPSHVAGPRRRSDRVDPTSVHTACCVCSRQKVAHLPRSGRLTPHVRLLRVSRHARMGPWVGFPWPKLTPKRSYQTYIVALH